MSTFEVWKRLHSLYYVRTKHNMNQVNMPYISQSTGAEDKLIRKNFITYESAINFILILNKLKNDKNI